MARIPTEEDLDRLRLHLIRRAQLFDDPENYRLGVDEAIAAMSGEIFGSSELPEIVAPAQMI
jgi:hypothetical protein